MIPSKRHEAGARFGSYEIVRSLGVGGMASVYEARHTTLGKRVAIKVLHEHFAENSVTAARFVREGRAASAIRHPNVVEVFEVGVQAGTPYLVIELLEGQDLAAHLRTHVRLSSSEAVDILLPTASAVAAAHTAGVIHRDLKPRNVFLARERRSGLRPKVVDFGVSKVLGDRDHGLTETDTLLGTVDYMAPEQARSARNAAEASDQYALGVILYECVTGQRPFAGNSTYELLHAIVTASFASPRSIGVNIDPRLEAVILRAMHQNPAERFPSVQSLGCALLPFASEALRAWWHEDFQTAAAVHASESPQDTCTPPREVAASRDASFVDATMLEDGALEQEKRLPRRRIAWRLLLGAVIIGVVGATSVRNTYRAEAPGLVGRGAPLGQALTTSPQARASTARDEGLVFPEEPREAPSRVAPAVHRDRGPMNRPSAPSSSPSLDAPRSAAPPPSSIGRPAAMPRVERGYNGAPIIE